MTFKRSVLTSLRNWSNPRTIIFIFIFCLVILYVFWTTSGNSTIQFFQQENLINPIVTTTTISSTTTTTTVKSLLLSSLKKLKQNNYDNKNIDINDSEIKGSYHMNFLPPPPQSPPKHFHINYLDSNSKQQHKLLFTNNNKILLKTETKGDNVAVDSMNHRKLIKNSKNIAGNFIKPYGSTVVAAKNINHNNLKKSLVKPEKEIEPVVINDTMEICGESFDDVREYIQNRPQIEFNDLPIIYFVTPSYPRREQIPELTRLGQTLMHVPRLHWIVADDVVTCNKFLLQFLSKFGIPFTHISSPMPSIYRSKTPSPRGVANRRAALKWLKNNNKNSGVLYFGDDDNTFDLKLFSEIRDTKIVSMFPVGLIGLYAVSTPVVKNGKVIGFFDSWPAKRKWPVDMAGFAISLQYLTQHPNASMPYKAGYEEDAFLRSISLKLEDIEPKANNCTETLVWHTQTQKTKSPTVKVESRFLDYDLSSLGQLFNLLESMGVSHASATKGIKAQISKDGKSKSFSFFFR